LPGQFSGQLQLLGNFADNLHRQPEGEFHFPEPDLPHFL
jgi:hypothetical protein